MKNKWIVGGVIIAIVVVAMAFFNLQTNSVYFYTPDEVGPQAEALSKRTIKIGGMVKHGSIEKNMQSLVVKFILSDMKETDISVVYNGTPPDIFKEDSGVVVEGQLSPDGKSFKAHQLMVKHSEEYKVPEEKHHSIDKKLLEKSIFGTQP